MPINLMIIEEKWLNAIYDSLFLFIGIDFYKN